MAYWPYHKLHGIKLNFQNKESEDSTLYHLIYDMANMPFPPFCFENFMKKDNKGAHFYPKKKHKE